MEHAPYTDEIWYRFTEHSTHQAKYDEAGQMIAEMGITGPVDYNTMWDHGYNTNDPDIVMKIYDRVPESFHPANYRIGWLLARKPLSRI